MEEWDIQDFEMNKSKQYIQGLRAFSKWQLSFVLAMLVLGIVICYVHTPLAVTILQKCVTLHKNNQVIKHADDFDGQIQTLNNENRVLDSLLIEYRKRCEREKTSIVEALYTCADSAGIKASKVEIGEPKQVDNHNEVAIAVHGTGAYDAIGKFVAMLENARQPVRISSMVIDSENERLVNMSIDFVIVE